MIFDEMIHTNSLYIIAEAGVNHNGSLELARQMIVKAAEAGADAIKFQSFSADKLVCQHAPKAPYQTTTTGTEESQHDMLRKLELDEDAHEILIKCCRDCGIEFLSSPFDLSSVDLLANRFHVSTFKIPSGEITNAPLLLKIAQSGKPVLLSTGMSTLGEIEDALGVLAFGYLGYTVPSRLGFHEAYCSEEGQCSLRNKVILLHCTTEYPAPYEDVDLKTLATLRTAFGLPVGYSDHTQGLAIPIAAVALGSVVIEKHFTLDRSLPGPDHNASLEPGELKNMVIFSRQVAQALGKGRKIPSASEWKNRPIARKSLVAAKQILSGELYSVDNLTVKRPGVGISPMLYWEYLGTPAIKEYAADKVILP